MGTPSVSLMAAFIMATTCSFVITSCRDTGRCFSEASFQRREEPALKILEKQVLEQPNQPPPCHLSMRHKARAHQSTTSSCSQLLHRAEVALLKGKPA